MAKIHIDQATITQLDYAVAVAKNLTAKMAYDGSFCLIVDDGKHESYSPTIDQKQCGELIDDYKISLFPCDVEWAAGIDSIVVCYDKSRLVAACKAFLWSKYPDGMIPVQADGTNTLEVMKEFNLVEKIDWYEIPNVFDKPVWCKCKSDNETIELIFGKDDYGFYNEIYEYFDDAIPLTSAEIDALKSPFF